MTLSSYTAWAARAAFPFLERLAALPLAAPSGHFEPRRAFATPVKAPNVLGSLLECRGGPPVETPSAGRSVATFAAIAGLMLPAQGLSAGLLVVVVGCIVGVLVLPDVRRRRSRRDRSRITGAESPLSRLEYLAAVTTPARRVHWRGGPSSCVNTKRHMRCIHVTGGGEVEPVSSVVAGRGSGAASSMLA